MNEKIAAPGRPSAPFVLLVASTLALLAHLDMLGPWTLVALTFALGVGAAMAMPAQQATTPELVPRAMLGPAVALGSLSMNIGRAIGPALGGLIVASAGIKWAFAVNALTFLGLIVVLVAWRREPSKSVLPPEAFGVALRAGLRYATQASVLQSVLIKAASSAAHANDARPPGVDRYAGMCGITVAAGGNLKRQGDGVNRSILTGLGLG